MRKLGKGAKQSLISGIIITLVGVGLLILNISVFPVLCIVSGSMLVFIGTPYINGVEYPHVLEEEHQKRNLELASKREYVKNNMHKFGIGAGIKETKSQKNIDCTISTIEKTDNKPQVIIDKKSNSVLSQATFNLANQEINNAIYTSNTIQQEQNTPVLTKKRK